jgi:hypothetical protein
LNHEDEASEFNRSTHRGKVVVESKLMKLALRVVPERSGKGISLRGSSDCRVLIRVQTSANQRPGKEHELRILYYGPLFIIITIHQSTNCT